ncbi:unnamed protein product [Cyprideis torosa]|uniref:Bridge-like lipid transfer protein family member 1 C-terminal domain-containing protein n=1 Tax=Cyprideis torosa TaxID=163714 RepID=A0A7R8WDT7_9CRUS|nr:unnamed protein product [Cyprideis torosa]CAG0888902.1 unnamed protein product [Cyprideis torosa]
MNMHKKNCNKVFSDRRGGEAPAAATTPASHALTERRKSKVPVPDPVEMLQKDFREFICKTWQLEPTVRAAQLEPDSGLDGVLLFWPESDSGLELIAWGGKQIEPYGVDYILNKLGFSRARITIPKWIQRGFMDPMDKAVSVVVYKLLVALKDEKHDGASITGTTTTSSNFSSPLAHAHHHPSSSS